MRNEKPICKKSISHNKQTTNKQDSLNIAGFNNVLITIMVRAQQKMLNIHQYTITKMKQETYSSFYKILLLKVYLFP